jgi:membrane fusion protein (multidrug efflux system)
VIQARHVGVFLVGAWLGAVCAPAVYGAEQVNAETEIRAQLTARYSTTLSAEIAASIRQLRVREGERFKKGDLLVAFDCSVQQAQLQKAQASVEGAAKAYEVNSRLSQLESVSSLEVEASKAKLGEAKADIALTQAALSKCRINAPFSGRVVTLPAHAHQFLKVGDPIMDILDDSELELKLIVPSAWLRWLKPGLAFQFHLDELDKDYPAKIHSIGASIDPVSQTLPVVANITGKHKELLTGMSGRALFNLPTQ